MHLSLTDRLLSPDIASSRRRHGSNHARAFRVNMTSSIGRHESPGRLVGHLELPSFLIQVKLVHLVVTETVSVGVSVVRLEATLILILDKFVLVLDAVLARDASYMLVLRQILFQVSL